MSNVAAFPGCKVPSKESDATLVRMLEDLLERAKSGDLRSFVGTGFVADGGRLAFWADWHPSVYEMRGALAWLETEYVHRHPEALG